jgi:Flp pilus assembly protein TadD
LLTHADVAKHASDIVDVTARHFMPPWLPADPPGKFTDERRLTPAQIALLARWVSEGKVEGDPKDLPPTPEWPSDWILGKPDLVVELPAPYVVPAEGRDVYRNVVIPAPLDRSRFVEAIEFHPRSQSVHHAFILMDRTGGARRQDAQDPEPGFPGMNTPTYVESAGGQFMSWQPGKIPKRAARGLSWRMDPGTDFVVQLHLQPRGKAEPVQPAIGIYFTDQAPTNRSRKLVLTTYAIDIPPGSTNVVVADGCELPGDFDLIAVLPHTHYLGKHVLGSAVLPGGHLETLLDIPWWDFRWQGEYAYVKPKFLPKGTQLRMQLSFDNSTNNPMNPHRPPLRVGYGSNTTDEMAEFWLQLLPRTEADGVALDRLLLSRTARDTVELAQHRLRLNPRDAHAELNLGRVRLMERDLRGAAEHFGRAAEFDPKLDEAPYYQGIVFRLSNRLPEAEQAFKQAIALNPDHARAHGNLGIIYVDAGRTDEAADLLSKAAALDPSDALAREQLGLIRWRQGRLKEAEELLSRAVELEPGMSDAATALRAVRAGQPFPKNTPPR